ncbi:MAG: carboxypeptidase-like regulatory domain-containing protein, partial [Myxococcaceae bacterium]
LVLMGPYPTGDYLLVAKADGFKTAEQPVKIGSGEAQVELVLSSGTFIRGRVLDEYGRPAPRISVLVNPTGDVAYADDQGQFSAEVPSPGFYELQAHHSDWGGGELQVTAPAEDVELLLEPKAGLRVTVSSDGRRLEGADVVLWLGREGSYRSDRPSGSDGVVLMRGMPPGRYSLVAAHRDHLPSDRKQVELRDGELLEISVELEPGAAISGEVVDQNGAPVAGAQVMAVPRGAEPTLTDGSGRFEIRPLRPDRSYRVEVQQSGFDQRERVTARPGGEPLRIVLERRSIYRGRVVSEDGAALRSFRIDEKDVTSPDGTFELPLPTESGRVFAVVEAQGHQPNMIDAPADQRDLGEIRLSPEPQVQGRVVDSMGAPVEGASMTCDMCNGQVTSDAKGVFSLSVPSRVGSVNVMGKKGALSGTVTWKANGNAPLEVTLRNAVHVTGRVFDPDGSPAGGVQVEAIHVDRSEPFSFVTMQDGSYAVDLPEGSYRVLLGTQRPFGGEPITFVRVSGSAMTLDFGPAPGASSVVVTIQPGPGQALWIVRGEVGSVSVPPMELFKSAWAQMQYQPRSKQVVFSGLAPGRYTVVWSQFHSKDETPPTIRVINVPGTSELSLLP